MSSGCQIGAMISLSETLLQCFKNWMDDNQRCDGCPINLSTNQVLCLKYYYRPHCLQVTSWPKSLVNVLELLILIFYVLMFAEGTEVRAIILPSLHCGWTDNILPVTSNSSKIAL